MTSTVAPVLTPLRPATKTELRRVLSAMKDEDIPIREILVEGRNVRVVVGAPNVVESDEVANKIKEIGG